MSAEPEMVTLRVTQTTMHWWGFELETDGPPISVIRPGWRTHLYRLIQGARGVWWRTVYRVLQWTKEVAR